MAKKRRIGNSKVLYAACKNWRSEEARSTAEPSTLAEVWERATKEDTFRRYVLRTYEVDRACNFV